MRQLGDVVSTPFGVGIGAGVIMGGMRRSLVIDADTASDDAVALLLAVDDPTVDIRAVTVVAGNVPLGLAVRNTIVTLDLCGGGDIPGPRRSCGASLSPTGDRSVRPR